MDTSTADANASNVGPMLVVDDDETVRLYHRAILERRGYRVLSAASGQDALEVLERHDISLVLLDERMPGMAGLDVLTEVRARGLGTPVMMVTAADGRSDRITGFESGADDYVAKPVDPSELGARIEALFRGREAAVGAAQADALDRGAHAEILRVVRDGLFGSVFQPIIDVRDGVVVAAEALTRFEDGERPDLRFGRAQAVGLGAELELACLTSSIREASQLPEGVDVHLNISPRLLGHRRLSDVLSSSPRRVVVELTEHERIDDYAATRRGLARLGPSVRLAIDDAGAGFASMTHILALRPDEVKLDQLWVRGVDDDPARQALISGMVSFAEATDTRLIAEGVETDAEALALSALGVRYAQGFRLGRPKPAADCVARI